VHDGDAAGRRRRRGDDVDLARPRSTGALLRSELDEEVEHVRERVPSPRYACMEICRAHGWEIELDPGRRPGCTLRGERARHEARRSGLMRRLPFPPRIVAR